MAIGAVAAERLGRRGPLVRVPALLLGVALGVGLWLAVESDGAAPQRPMSIAATVPPAWDGAPAVALGAELPAATPPAIVSLSAVVTPAVPEAEPTAAPTSRPASAGGARNAPVPTIPAPALAPPISTAPAAPTATPPTATVPAPPTAMPIAGRAASRETTVIPILMYHYVRVVNDPKDQIGINLSVRPEQFAAQMQYLADRGYTTLTMAEVHAILAGERPAPPKPIALTFDDGYRDFYSAAWPVLKRHSFKATAYVATDFIGRQAYLTWPMLHELDASGQIEFGAHTRSHADLRALSPGRRWDEIIGSKAILEEGLGHPIGAFCYPAGFRNAEVVADVRRANFLTAVTVQSGNRHNLGWAYELPRIRVHGPDPLAAWASKLP